MRLWSLGACALALVLLGCHEEFIPPDQPDLYKPRRSFDLSGIPVEEDLSVDKVDMAHSDLVNSEQDAA